MQTRGKEFHILECFFRWWAIVHLPERPTLTLSSWVSPRANRHHRWRGSPQSIDSSRNWPFDWSFCLLVIWKEKKNDNNNKNNHKKGIAIQCQLHQHRTTNHNLREEGGGGRLKRRLWGEGRLKFEKNEEGIKKKKERKMKHISFNIARYFDFESWTSADETERSMVKRFSLFHFPVSMAW